MALKRKVFIGLSAVLFMIMLWFSHSGAPNFLPITHAATNGTYSTTFPLKENPISEAGNWISGAAAGHNLWGDVQTSAGFVFGVSEPTVYGDPTAILTGSWGASQQVHAVIKINSQPTQCCHEIEVRLLSAISNNSITGYEINYSAVPSNKYVQLVRWNGPNGNFTYIDQLQPSTAASNGDVIDASATVSGGTVTFTYKINGVTQTFTNCHCTNPKDSGGSAFTSGNPGLGFYDNQDSNWSSFGYSSFSATGPGGTGTGTSPLNAPTNLTVGVN